MEQKLKNFDRHIEQLMNENAVSPPFGMWNRISAELDAQVVPVPASVNSPIPQRTIIGFIAGAVLIGASLITAYLVDNSSKSETTTATINTTIVTPAINTPAKLETTPVVIAKAETKPVVRSSKPKLIPKPVEEKMAPVAETTPAPALSQNAEVMVPTQDIAENHLNTEPYYFPAIDMGTRESKPAEKIETPVSKSKVLVKGDEEEEREDAPRVKFHPQKHRSWKFGRYNRLK